MGRRVAMQVAVGGEAGMEKAKGMAKALQGILGGTVLKGKIVSKGTGTDDNTRTRSETRRSNARWGALGHHREREMTLVRPGNKSVSVTVSVSIGNLLLPRCSHLKTPSLKNKDCDHKTPSKRPDPFHGECFASPRQERKHRQATYFEDSDLKTGLP